MKKMIALIIAAALISGCTSSNEYGPCIGAFDDKAPGVPYRLSVKNTILAIIFFETIIVPIVVVADETRCPSGPPKPVK